MCVCPSVLLMLRDWFCSHSFALLSLLSACHLKKKWRKGNAKNITVTLALLFLEVKFLFVINFSSAQFNGSNISNGYPLTP